MKMIKLFLVLMVICGGVYPLVVTAIGLGVFPEQASGSLVKEGDAVIGSSLLAQKFSGDAFFHSRPSAADYATVASGASNASVIQKAALEQKEQRRAALPDAGVDAWTTSASGLDPHISPETAFAQIPRVAAARGLSTQDLRALVQEHIEGATWGIWGQPRINVLELNRNILKGINADSRPVTGKP